MPGRGTRWTDEKDPGGPRQTGTLLPLLAAGLLAISGCDGDGGGTSGGSAGSGGTSGSGGAGGTGGSGGAAECTPPPSEIASVQKVKVTLTNTASSDRFLVTDCHDCDVLLVEQKTEIDYTPLPLRISAADACGCECPNPGDPYAAGFRRIAPGESFEAVWDARALSTCTASIDCGEGFTAKVKSGALQPVDAGEYRVSFGFVETLPRVRGRSQRRLHLRPPANLVSISAAASIPSTSHSSPRATSLPPSTCRKPASPLPRPAVSRGRHLLKILA
ncbi:MAG: hypothetical protein R3F14_26750 [Polyangiaceae bacterium]